jgi:hypothetical protein
MLIRVTKNETLKSAESQVFITSPLRTMDSVHAPMVVWVKLFVGLSGSESLKSSVFVTAASRKPCDAKCQFAPLARGSNCPTSKKQPFQFGPRESGSQEKTGFSNSPNSKLRLTFARSRRNQSAILAQLGKNWLRGRPPERHRHPRWCISSVSFSNRRGVRSTLQERETSRLCGHLSRIEALNQGTKRVLDRYATAVQNSSAAAIAPEGKYPLRSRPAP